MAGSYHGVRLEPADLIGAAHRGRPPGGRAHDALRDPPPLRARGRRGVTDLGYGLSARGPAVKLDADVYDLATLARDGCVPEPPETFAGGTLAAFLARGADAWQAVDEALLALDRERAAPARLDDAGPARLPIAVADYVDFYASEFHAANVGRLLRPDGDPLAPNWRHLPVGYHGRSSTVVVSGTPVVRPHGQLPRPDGPVHGPTEALDFELEVGWVVGTPSAHGEPVPVGAAASHLFGAVLLNDWSARDVQAWESTPLGPFLGKSFATSISRWITPRSVLDRRRVAVERPRPLDYLVEAAPQAHELALEAALNGEAIVRTNARHLHWSPAQMVAHLTANGACLSSGDLLGTGTVSGPRARQRGVPARAPAGALARGRRRGRAVRRRAGPGRGTDRAGPDVSTTATAPARPSRWRAGPARLARLALGLWLFGTGEGMVIGARLGNSPWTVLSEGVSKHTPLSVGTATIAISFAVILLWIPLRQPPGLGTIANATFIGVAIDVTLGYLPGDPSLPLALVELVGGILLVGHRLGLLPARPARARSARRADGRHPPPLRRARGPRAHRRRGLRRRRRRPARRPGRDRVAGLRPADRPARGRDPALARRGREPPLAETGRARGRAAARPRRGRPRP